MDHSEIELKVRMLLEEVLSRTGIEATDGFLMLGGDSLCAMLMMSRLRRDFGVELSIEDFFIEPVNASTIAHQIVLLSGDRT